MKTSPSVLFGCNGTQFRVTSCNVTSAVYFLTVRENGRPRKMKVDGETWDHAVLSLLSCGAKWTSKNRVAFAR